VHLIPPNGQETAEVEGQELVESLLVQSIGGQVGQHGDAGGQVLGQLEALHPTHGLHVPVPLTQPDDAHKGRQQRQEVVEVEARGPPVQSAGRHLDAVEKAPLGREFGHERSDPLLTHSGFILAGGKGHAGHVGGGAGSGGRRGTSGGHINRMHRFRHYSLNGRLTKTGGCCHLHGGLSPISANQSQRILHQNKTSGLDERSWDYPFPFGIHLRAF